LTEIGGDIVGKLAVGGAAEDPEFGRGGHGSARETTSRRLGRARPKSSSGRIFLFFPGEKPGQAMLGLLPPSLDTHRSTRPTPQ
jgi:hypothetical protein